MFLAVAAAQSVLIGALDLSGSAIRTTRTADEPAPYYLSTERPPRPAPKDHADERRPTRKRKPEAPSAGAASPASASPQVPAAPPAAAAGPPTPDYGRWTVGPGAWPEAGHGRIVMSVCAPANLASLPAEARTACAASLKTAAAGPPAPRGAAQDWKDHGPLSSCAEPKNEPAHKLLLDRCRGLGIGLKVLF